MMQSGHGGNIRSAARESGLEASAIIDFSSNINPRGMPPAAREAAAALLQDPGLSAAYPEPYPEELAQAIAAGLGLGPGAENIVPANGSTEIIYLLPQVLKPRRAMIVEPAFSEYARALSLTGAKIVPFLLREEEDFALDLSALGQAMEETRPHVLYMANPSNPVGRLETRKTMEQAADLCRELGAALVIDEAFMDFVSRGAEFTMVRAAAAGGRIIVLRSMTKFFGLAALRLGFAVGSRALMKKIREHLPPWSVNAAAAAAAAAALEDRTYVERTLAWLAAEAPFLKEALEAIPGIKVYPSSANYFAARLTGPPGLTAGGLRTGLLGRGILIRDLSNVRGLGRGFFRAAVRSRGENELLLRALREVTAAAGQRG